MAIIKGTTVYLLEKTQTGVDGFNQPIYKETPTAIANVLVAPASSDDVINSINLYGKKAVYTLGIPKGDTHDWEDKKVQFFGHTWRTFGFTIIGLEHQVPLDWHKKVMVERYG